MTTAPVPQAPATSVHDRKRRKNLAILLLVLGWCALIFMVTMAKLAHADEFAPAPASKPFPNERNRHEAKIDQSAADFLVTRTSHQKAIDGADSNDVSDTAKPPATPATDDGQSLKFGVTSPTGAPPR